MSGFNFGLPTSTGATGGSLFGTASNTTQGGGGLFGGGSTGGASTNFSFGSTAATSKPGATPSLLGTAAPGNSAAAGAPTGLFGQTAGGATSGFSFGQKTDEIKTSDQPKPSLFATSTSQPPATPSSSGPSFFGTTTPAATSGQTFSFGNPSTTPAGNPPQANTFGASTGGSGLFGSVQNQDATKPSTFAFGKPVTITSGADTTKSQSTPNLFGTTQPMSGGMFGAKPADKTNPVTQSGSTESAKPTLSFGAPPTAAAGPKDTSTPSIFGTVPSSAATNTTPATQPTPSLFGMATAPTSQAASSGALFGKPATTSATTTNLFGQTPKLATDSAAKPTFAFPSATSQSTPAPSQTPSTTAAAPKPLFGGLAATTGAAGTAASPSPFKLPTTTAAQGTSIAGGTAAPSGGLFSLGGSSAPASSAAATTTSGATGGLLAFGGTTNASTVGGATTISASAAPTTAAGANLGASTLGASTAGPVPPAQSRLRNKTLDEILTRWATDLTRYTKEFKTQAETIAHWDQIIVDNSSKIDKLYIKTRTCEKQTMSVEMQLAAVENQQNELEAWLSKYENDVDEMLAKEGPGQSELGGPDQERERTYKLAEKLGERLEDMDRDLESMVEQVNAANASLSKHTKADEPITQIVRILNSHLTQLQQIDQGAATLQSKVSAAQKTATHLGYLNGNVTSEGRAAVEDFYRSYMGRR